MEQSLELKSVGDEIAANVAAWSFGGDTPKHFEPHIMRSVPLYEKGHEIILQLSDFFVAPDSVCYEIGSSTGRLISSLAKRHPTKGKWIGVDIEPNMTDFASQALCESSAKLNLSFVTADACEYEYEPSDLIVAYYSIQFIRPRIRQLLFDRLYASLNWGGAFIMFEKVRAPDARFQDICSGLYNDFKISNEFSADQILAKSNSLRGILEPFSSQGNVDLLRRAGFTDMMSVFKYICFEGFLAIK
ncbi:MAG: methyltransferase domain-containing protein [Cyanobacteriota bacterium]